MCFTKNSKKSLEILKNKLLKPIDKSWEITNKIEWKINTRIKKINTNFKSLSCKEYSNEKLNHKLVVLNQTIYEMCKYTTYLEYLKEYNSNLKNIIWISEDEINSIWKDWNEETNELLNKKKYSLFYINKLKEQKRGEIDEEISNSFKIFSLAYHAYSEYENNFIVHVLLEIIREDFIVLRDKLNSTLSPINQVVYKIANAMSK